MAHSKPKQKIAEPAKLHFFIMLIILGNYSHCSLHQMISGKDDNKTIAKAIHMHKMQFLLRNKRHNISHAVYSIRGVMLRPTPPALHKQGHRLAFSPERAQKNRR